MENVELPELISPYEAVEMLEQFYGTTETKRMLADKMRDGAIRAYARRSWVSTEALLKDARNGKAPRRAKRDVVISPAKLVGAERWIDESTLFKWRKGVFHSVIRSRPMKRRIFRGVGLAREDVAAVWRKAADHEKLKKNTGGRRRNETAWDRVFVAVLELIRDQQFDISNPCSSTQLTKLIILKLGGEPPADAAFENKTHAEIEALKSSKSPLAGTTVSQLLQAVFLELGFTKGRAHRVAK